MKKILFALLCAAVMCGCNSGVRYSITVAAADDIDEIHLLKASTMEEVAELTYDGKNGVFEISGKADAPFIGALVDGGDSPLTIVFIENGDIFVDFDEEEFNYVASGTPSNEANIEGRAEIESIIARFHAIEEPDEEQQTAFMDELVKTIYRIVDENCDNIYGAYMFESAAAMEEDPAVILSYLDKFPAQLQEGEILKPIREYAEASMKVSSGAGYIDVVAENTEGDIVSLSEVVDSGKWVLLDFWATWCGPCRGELPYLKAAYEKYADKGFEIFGVSLDNNKAGWLSFVPANGMTWINVIDVNEDKETPAADAYGIRSIPTNFLISPEGEIVAKNLRGEAVEEKLAEIFE